MHHRSTSINTQGVWAYMALALLALVLQVTSGSPAQRSSPLLIHHLSKRSFFEINCKGIYDASKFARLDRICDDCYDLFHETPIHLQCRSECFSTEFFKGCVEALLLTEDMEIYERMVDYIGGK